ncbi:MAG: helix-turn-helix domain-containing protein [Pseudobutyrivibrio sp.]|nr:helix-turn-helix domain-containing protein [Pseudobutyrivibrio sp.]
MKNERIGSILRYYRKLNDLSVADVVKLLESEDTFVAEKTIYGWENSQTQPDADNLLKLCKIYHIDDILSAFEYQSSTSEPLHITEFEEKLVRSYRERPEFHNAIKKLLEMDKPQ